MILSRKLFLITFITISVSILSALITNSSPQTSNGLSCQSTISVTESTDDNVCTTTEVTPVTPVLQRVCLTSACNVSAESVLNKIDATVDPCDNFYNFACGNFIKNTVVPDDTPMEMLFTVMARKIKDQIKILLEAPIVNDEIKPFKYLKQFYQKCTNKSEIELNSINSAKAILNQTGNWPVFQENQWNSDEFDIKNVTYNLRQMGLPFDSLLSVYVDASSNNTNNILYIERPELPMETEYLIQGLNNSKVQAYLDLVVNISVALGAERSFANKEFNESMLFAIQLANVTDWNLVRNSSTHYTMVSINEFNAKHPFFPWVDYLNHMIANEHIQISVNETLHVKEIEFIPELEKLLKTTPKRVQANYLLFRVLYEFSPFLTEEIQNFTLEYNRIAYGVTKSPVGWKHCIINIPEGLERIAGALYVRTFFDTNTKLKAIELVKNLKSTFINIIEDANWMDNTTKLTAVEKANAMDANIAFPDEILDDQVLEQFYKNLTITTNNSLIEIFLKVNKFNHDANFIKLGTPINTTYWVDQMAATTLNAQYWHEKNSINVAAAILQGESYDINRPEYMNYGSVGFVIGHEIVHGFDQHGRKFDKDGKEKNWWANSTETEYINKTDCIIKQYNNYTVPKFNLHVDGTNTLSENIADNSAAKAAYLAYQHWITQNDVEQLLPGVNYTQNQLFWISCAQYLCSVETDEYLKDTLLVDHHSPMEFRVKGTFSNSEYFAKDFNCSLGSNMNPQHKCRVW